MSKSYSRTFVVFVLVLFFIQSCAIQSPFEIYAVTPTQTPTPLICPTGILSTSEVLEIKPKLIIALFEDSRTYRPYALQDIEVMNQALENTVKSGDRLIMLRMGKQTLETEMFLDMEVESSSYPIIPSSPTPFPTPTATLPPLSAPDTVFSQSLATKSAISTAVSIQATATQSAFLFNCASNDWNNQYLALENQYQVTQKKAVNDFIEQVRIVDSEFIDSATISNTSVWNSLFNASKILEYECSRNKYDRCVLIVFSDMNEVAMQKPDNLEVNLRNAEFLGVMSSCPSLYSGECARWREFWQENLNAKSVDFINENILETLSAFLR